MKISLVIPAYNEEKYIGACLENACKNNHGFHEIIVVNNASTDKTEEIVKNFPEVRLVREPSKGLTKARQRGFLEAKGDVIAYIDADTKMPAGWAEKVSIAFEKNPKIVCVSGPYIYYDLSYFGKLAVWLYWLLLAYPAYLAATYMVIGGNFATKKNALEKIGGFDKNISFYGEDTNIARRLSKVGKVKFMQNLYMYTSARRLKGEGTGIIAVRYALNFLSEAIIRKPITSEYKDIR